MTHDDPGADSRADWIDFSSREGRAVGYIIWFCWASAISAGVLALRDDPMTDLVPVVTVAVLVALIIRHHEVPGGRAGLLMVLTGLLLVPALDLLLYPPCDGLESLRFEPLGDGSLKVSCVQTVDMTLEVVSAFAGFIVVLALSWFLIRRRPRAGLSRTPQCGVTVAHAEGTIRFDKRR